MPFFCSLAAKSSFLAAVSNICDFLKDLVLKSDNRNSVFPNCILPQTFALLLFPIPVSQQSCWGIHDALTYADACSDLGHPSESLHWETLHGIRSLKKIDLALDILILILSSNASLCILCVCVTAAKSGFLVTNSHKLNFSKRI